MANFPIEIRVKLTYYIFEVILMASFCLECWNKINNRNDPPRKYIISKSLDLCEGCGEWKHVLVMERKYYYFRKFRFIIIPVYIIWRIIFLLLKLTSWPFRKIFSKYRKKHPVCSETTSKK